MSLSKLAILGVLMENPAHGYELKRYFERHMGVFWMINYGSIYPALKKLEREGCIVGKKEPTNTVDRIVYRITEKGKKEFAKILKERVKKDIHVRDEFTLHLYFLDYLGEEEKRELLLGKIRGNERLLKELSKNKETLKEKMSRYRFSAVERGLMHIKTELEWLNKTLREVQ